jgi:predicted permease
MRWLISLRSLWQTLVRPSRLDRDLDDELRAYVEMLTERHVRAGLSPAAARRAALVQSEGVEQIKEKVRDARIGAGVESVLRDLRFAARSLRRDPGFAVTTIFVLAVGIGLNVTMFSVVNGLLLRPLPYPHDDRLVFLDERVSGQDGTMKVALANFADWQDRQRVFTAMAAYRRTRVTLSGDADAERVEALVATTALFRVLGINPAAGRGFTTEDAEANVVVLSDLLWRQRYEGKPIVGRTITVNGAPQTVAGIMPPGFSFPERARIWIPTPISRTPQDRSGHGWWVVARLTDGRTLADARAEMADIGRQLVREHPDINGIPGTERRVEPLVMPYRDEVVEPEIRASVLIAMAAVGLVLLIACVNIANLVLTRGSARGREIALRAALGAGRWRIVRQLMAEGLVLAALGAVGGLVVGRLGLIAANAALPINAPAWMGFTIDLTVIAFTVGLVLATAVAFGLAPAVRASRADLRGELAGSDGRAGSRRVGVLRHGLVVAEVSMAMVLLVCAALMTRAFLRILAIAPGFSAQRVVTMQVSPPQATYRTPDSYLAFHADLLDAIRAIPGVRQAGGGTWLPSQQANWVPMIIPERTVASSRTGRFPANAVVVTPGYFEALGITRVRGRTFTSRDGLAGTPGVVIVNRTFVTRHWPEGDPIGRRLKYWMGPGNESAWLSVIGVVDDVLGGRGNAPITTYYPLAQEGGRTLTLVVKTASDPMAAVGTIRQRLAGLDRDVPLTQILTMEAVVDGLYWMPRMLMRLFGVFGGFALILAAAGVYGVLAYTVSGRTREIGIRTALGATQRQVATLVLRQGLVPTVVGIAIGFVASLGITRLLRGLLYDVSPTDPWSFGFMTVVLLGAALAACYLPALRARRVDPIAALRCE